MMAGACSCAQIWKEFHSSLFSLEEPPKSIHVETVQEGGDTEGDSVADAGEVLCVKRSFGVADDGSIYRALILKVVLFGWVISIWVQSIVDEQYPGYWFAYLTHWGWVFTSLYFFSSIITTLVIGSSSRQQRHHGAGFLPKYTWALFSLVLPMEILISLLFWTLEFPDTITYVDCMVHGGGVALILFDGLVINRIPIRAKQIVFVESISVVYLIWSVIHALTGIGNPNRSDLDSETDDDAIYGSVAWKQRSGKAILVVVLAILIANPLVFFICRFITRLPPRRLLPDVSGSSTSPLLGV